MEGAERMKVRRRCVDPRGTPAGGRLPRLFLLGAAVSLSACTMIGSPELEERARPPGTEEAPATASEGAAPASAATGSYDRTAEPLSAGGNMDEYEQSGRRYRVLDSSEGYDQRGVASWYGNQFHGRSTSSGETYDMHGLTAAHRTLPLPSWVRVTNLANGRSVVVRVNDRGPFSDPDRRIIDVSYAAALELGMVETGTASVRVQAVEPFQYRNR